MIHIEFQYPFGFGDILAAGFEDLFHIGAHVISISRQAGHGILQVSGRLNFLYLLFQAGFDEIEKSAVLFFFLVIDLVQFEISLFGAFEGLWGRS